MWNYHERILCGTTAYNNYNICGITTKKYHAEPPLMIYVKSPRKNIMRDHRLYITLLGATDILDTLESPRKRLCGTTAIQIYVEHYEKILRGTTAYTLLGASDIQYTWNNHEKKSSRTTVIS